MSWQSDAACKGIDIDEFYVSKGRVVSRRVQEACWRCPVKAKCLLHALKHEEYGYWAGTNSVTRKNMRKELGIKLESINTENIIQETIDMMSAAASIWDNDSEALVDE